MPGLSSILEPNILASCQDIIALSGNEIDQIKRLNEEILNTDGVGMERGQRNRLRRQTSSHTIVFMVGKRTATYLYFGTKAQRPTAKATRWCLMWTVEAIYTYNIPRRAV